MDIINFHYKKEIINQAVLCRVCRKMQRDHFRLACHSMIHKEYTLSGKIQKQGSHAQRPYRKNPANKEGFAMQSQVGVIVW
jgi:hypothetical protein